MTNIFILELSLFFLWTHIYSFLPKIIIYIISIIIIIGLITCQCGKLKKASNKYCYSCLEIGNVNEK